MTSIGFRVRSNNKIYYSIEEEDPDNNLTYRDISILHVPQSLNWPEALNFTRNTIIDIINLYEVKKAVIKINEYGSTYDKLMIQRTYIEGVLQEAIANSSVEKNKAGQISDIYHLLDIQKEDFKLYARGELNFINFPTEIGWGNLSLEERESILAANAALKL
ncbi:Uncharacterised protein [Chryseobacterium gleum]|uniref:Uncharacterized protein n=2 Tax=Chryseobacterium gleum TaxID=250 RepID=A0A3S4NRM1_CHRGE|nr:hypothetical protein [Chryseobacterium gleum]EFK34999.1 hypothetical protein HMPREF0204_14068 [Chryseobacterium gleum ATCC 35910]QQY30808.1 hypothetical protein I6I60_18320 [Chryseobacterium gleum]VEE04835.1 Uncharacterised protein [Chryseobacterium gleum]